MPVRRGAPSHLVLLVWAGGCDLWVNWWAACIDLKVADMLLCCLFDIQILDPEISCVLQLSLMNVGLSGTRFILLDNIKMQIDADFCLV
jgi:hypothetical protein